MDAAALTEQLTDYGQSLSRSEALANRRTLPKAGIYSWWFSGLDDLVPIDGCVSEGEWSLLYVGISPARESSKSSLPNRLSQHLKLNAEGSTLRLSLGVILSDRLGLTLRRMGSGKRLTFHCGEDALNGWLEDHARVVVAGCQSPWLYEPAVIAGLRLPINLDHNDDPFGVELSRLRAAARSAARSMPPNPPCCAN